MCTRAHMCVLCLYVYAATSDRASATVDSAVAILKTVLFQQLLTFKLSIKNFVRLRLNRFLFPFLILFFNVKPTALKFNIVAIR